MTETRTGCLIFLGILFAFTTGTVSQALVDESQNSIEEVQALNAIRQMLRSEPAYMIQALSNMRSRLPGAAEVTTMPSFEDSAVSSKRGIDFGLGRGYSGSQAAKHFMGIAAARYAGGPGKKRKRSQTFL